MSRIHSKTNVRLRRRLGHGNDAIPPGAGGYGAMEDTMKVEITYCVQ